MIPGKEGISLALWKIFEEDQPEKGHVFLTHGTFSDKRVCRGIASFLANHGYACWILEWREHGKSGGNGRPFNFESIGLEDIPAALAYLKEEQKIEKLHTITHSGGGICLTMALIEFPDFKPFVKTMTLFGCQAFGAAHTPSNFLKILLGKYMGALLGKYYGRKMGRAHDESFYTMKQWYAWNLNKKFLGAEQRDYQKQMPEISLPVLSIAAKGDTLIAPPEGCKLFLEAFQNPENRFWLLSKEAGNLEDYDHGRIMHSSSASKEIWPEVLKWMENNS